MGVQPGRSARRVIGLLKVDTQGLSQPCRGRTLLTERAECRRDELARSTRIVCRECRDLEFPIGTETTACKRPPAGTQYCARF